MLKIGIEGYGYSSWRHGGPNVFLDRLTRSIKKQNLAKVSPILLPFFDIALYKISSKNFFGKPFVLRVDGIYFDKMNTLGNSKKMNKPIFKSIDNSKGVIFISDFSRQLVEKKHMSFNKKNTVIHNAVDRRKFSNKGFNYRKKLGFTKEDRVLVTSAHWLRMKRLKETVKLFKKLNSESSRYKLIVLGGKPDFVVKDKDIHYIGEVPPDNLAPWYRTADVYIHMAWIEACGNTQIEAISCGIPVVCCNNGGIKETVEMTKGGIVVKADSPYQFNEINFYNPPEPNYDLLIDAIENIFSDKLKYVNQIDYQKVDINYVAKKYVNFIRNLKK